MAQVTTDSLAIHEPQLSYALPGFQIDNLRPIKVIAIGAGYSGIAAGIRFLQRVKNLNFTIYDLNSAVGGTWWTNRYPGLSCDIPSHCYQYSFESNPNWSAFYAPGPEIQKYLENVVDKYKLRDYIKLRHRITRAEWNELTGKWHLTIRRPCVGSETEKSVRVQWDWKSDYEEFEDTADFLFMGLGSLSRWSWPNIEGLETFRGRVIHSANWETEVQGAEKWEDSVRNWGDKRVGVIGVGSSGIQIVPALQPRVKHLTNYVRGKTWVTPTFFKERLVKISGRDDTNNYFFTEEDKLKFSNPDFYKNFRWEMESEMTGFYPASLLNHPISLAAKAGFRDDMLRRLTKRPWVAAHRRSQPIYSEPGIHDVFDSFIVIPDFSPMCRRLTPGPGYLEALCEDNVDFVPAHIKCVTPDGIMTEDGKVQNLDIIVCATGYETSFQYDFDIIGRGGVNLNDKYSPHPRTYLAVAVDGFPNMFHTFGPNSGVGNGSLQSIIEAQVDYAVAAALKLQRERLKSIEVKAEAVNDFDRYIDNYFPTTVFGEKCRSWYKAGKEEGRVVAIWPGSSLHAVRALAHPRWEDYNYERLDATDNRLYWLGDGSSVADHDDNADKAFYLKEIDYPPVPEL